jgi:hypothetical protein
MISDLPTPRIVGHVSAVQQICGQSEHHLDARNQPPQGLLNTRPICPHIGAALIRGSYPSRLNGWDGDFLPRAELCGETHNAAEVSPVRLRAFQAGTRKTTHRWVATMNRLSRSHDRQASQASIGPRRGAKVCCWFTADRNQECVQKQWATLETTRKPHDGHESVGKTDGLPFQQGESIVASRFLFKA